MPELLSRPARHGHDNATAGETFSAWRPRPADVARLASRARGIIENGELRDQVRGAVAIDVGHCRYAHDLARAKGVRGPTAASPNCPGSAEYVQKQRAILARNRQQRRRAVNGPDEVARAVAIEVGRGLDQLAWSLLSRRNGTAGAARRPGRARRLHGRAGRAASQTGLPVDPSRRIRVSPFHSMKSALPGCQHDGFGDRRKRDGLARQQAVVVERQVMSPRLAAIDCDLIGLAHAAPLPERADDNRRPAR